MRPQRGGGQTDTRAAAMLVREVVFSWGGEGRDAVGGPGGEGKQLTGGENAEGL